jgi:hypothetical protein
MARLAEKLTDEQRKQLEPAMQKLDRAFNEFSTQLASIVGDGEPGSGNDFTCFSCACQEFIAPTHGDRTRCARPTCGHRKIAHMW